jgi:hypothetical protein
VPAGPVRPSSGMAWGPVVFDGHTFCPAAWAGVGMGQRYRLRLEPSGAALKAFITAPCQSCTFGDFQPPEGFSTGVPSGSSVFAGFFRRSRSRVVGSGIFGLADRLFSSGIAYDVPLVGFYATSNDVNPSRWAASASEFSFSYAIVSALFMASSVTGTTGSLMPGRPLGVSSRIPANSAVRTDARSRNVEGGKPAGPPPADFRQF